MDRQVYRPGGDEVADMPIPDMEVIVYNWVTKFEQQNLHANDLLEFFAKYVPWLYSPKSEVDEEMGKKIIFESLEKFITGSNEPLQVFEHLKTLDSAPTLCCHIFKVSEVTYLCRDCALDPTCVLCVDCFQNSVHKDHRYRISMSSGGGYCDCGDDGAWKGDAHCKIHEAKIEDSEGSDPLQRVPQGIADRARFVIEAVLNYSNEILTWEHSISLPATLKATSTSDKFTTTLYNDEMHTYDQVITTLSRAMNCTQKTAVAVATQIDREGRSIVRCSSHANCKQLAKDIEKLTARHGNRPLKVLLIHSDIISHQNFALKLLAWIQHVLSYSEGFRIIFNDIMVKPDGQSSLLQSIMLSDIQLWKSARNQWHQLFISSMLLDKKCKKIFAKTFLRNYPTLMKDFIADDHEHSVSITSFSVQLFTMPLAHTLIEEEDALNILLRTFLSECEPNRNESGKLAFERNHFNATLSFRRANYILYDVKYLLTVKPKEWTDNLRKRFISGIQSLVQLLVWMEGMDSVVRKIGEHVEFEAEWESGINLQLKLAFVITLALEWCGTDYVVLIRVLRIALRKLESMQERGNLNYVNVELCNHSAKCIDYNVAYLPVSIHIPLSRFVAGLLLQLGKHDLKYSASVFALERQPTPEQLMELPLRTLVLIAEFRAGMWRRNGHSLLNQLFFYSNVKLRDEMFDRDIQMLQIAASLIDSDEFLIHLINKYGLIQWAVNDTNRKSEERERENEIMTIAEEFLLCILYIVSERYIPGLGMVDNAGKIKKEIIQLLCIEPMPHSQLFKLLPKDPNHETGMEAVINEVGNFKQTSNYKGKYELKPDFFCEFNLYYYHYSREEQSKAAEVQIKRKRLNGEEECCPPPFPVEFCPPFENIIGILQCDVFLHLMKVVLQRTLNNSESLIEKALFLINIALHEEVRYMEKDKNTFFKFTERASEKNIFSDIQECLNSQKVEAQKDLLKFTIRKFKAVESMREKQGENFETQMDFTLTVSDPKKDKKRNAALAAARRARIMAQMSLMQKNFIEGNADLFKAVNEESTEDTTEKIALKIKENVDPIAVGNNQRGKVSTGNRFVCILCREEQEVSTTGPTIVLAAFVQRSTVLSKNRTHKLRDPDLFDPLLMHSDLFTGPHISTCGHAMHSKCWQHFFDSVLNKERRRPIRYGRHISFNIDHKEFLCPLCERLSNTVIPLVPSITGISSLAPSPVTFDDFLFVLKKAVEKGEEEKERVAMTMKVPNISELMPEVDSGDHLPGLFMPPGPPIEEAPYHDSLRVMMGNFANVTYTVGLAKNVNPEDSRVPVMIWNSVAYTIHAMERMLRDKQKPIFDELSSRDSLCLQAIVRFSASSLIIFDKRIIQCHAIRLIQYLLVPEIHASSNKCCLSVDAFSLAVYLSLCLPSFFDRDDAIAHVPFGHALDNLSLRLIFVFHIIQIILTIDYDIPMHPDDLMPGPRHKVDGPEEIGLFIFYTDLVTASGVIPYFPTASYIRTRIQTSALPFLRCCAIYYHFLTDIPAPAQLQQPSNEKEEYFALCNYLGLPNNLNELFTPTMRQLALSWARHSSVFHLLTIKDEPIGPYDFMIRQPHQVNQLVSLPNEYSDLINSVSLFICSNSNDENDSRYPTMCLVCGEILCSQSYCCQSNIDGTLVGACSYHAHYCGAGIGLFLRIRDSKILLLEGKTKGCYLAPPYVDQYGETDLGLLRGNPLTLCPGLYQNLHRLWLSHGIPETIAHELEQSNNLSATNWQLL